MKDLDALIERAAAERARAQQAYAVVRAAQEVAEAADQASRKAEHELYEETERRVKELTEKERAEC